MDNKGRPNLRICICGGGNGAHTAAGYLSSKPGVQVNVFTRRPQDWKPTITVTTKTSTWADRGTFRGRLNKVSDKPEEIAPGCNIFFICAPANAHPHLLKAIAPYVDKGPWVGALYAQGGFDWAAKAAFGTKFDELGVLFGLQNIPWICKITTYGEEARILGPKKTLYVASYPLAKVKTVAKWMGTLFDIPCNPIPNFLNLTLTPSNQIIHPARYYGIFRDWDGKRVYTQEELDKRKGNTLYEDMDEFSAEELAVLDNELQQIKLALLQRYPQLDLSYVIPLGPRVVQQYGKDVSDPSSLKQIFVSNLGYRGCATPLTKVAGGFTPALGSRLFWEDIPYGLCILKNLAELLGNFPTPKIDFHIMWHQQFMGKKYLVNNQLNPDAISETGTPAKYGIRTLDELVSTSLPPPTPARTNKNSTPVALAPRSNL
jgi:hypothetical protein